MSSAKFIESYQLQLIIDRIQEKFKKGEISKMKFFSESSSSSTRTRSLTKKPKYLGNYFI